MQYSAPKKAGVTVSVAWDNSTKKPIKRLKRDAVLVVSFILLNIL